MCVLLNSVVVLFTIQAVNGLYDFQEADASLTRREWTRLNALLSDQNLMSFTDWGSDAVDKILRLEENLRNSDIIVRNSSLSHNQLLETLPNNKANEDNTVAAKILQASRFFYNRICIDNGISGNKCRDYLSQKSLPRETNLWKECIAILNEMPEGHHAFRRLLPSNYQDGLYLMNINGLPTPRTVSASTLHGRLQNVHMGNEGLDEGQRNLALVQWAQFIEHDLSKPVATSMRNGDPIECCNPDNYKLQPRYVHPACAPLIANSSSSPYDWESCLNYVRSALTVGSDCNFGAAKQLNQVSGYLDLSQLYGQADALEGMRTKRFGEIKSSQSASNQLEDMLPLATTSKHSFCTIQSPMQNETCFMAGDSRVNSNPYSIVLYTLFMRFHNKIAQQLHNQYPEWNDNQLFEGAKAINVAIYRRIVFNEWLPAVLGHDIVTQLKGETRSQSGKSHNSSPQISNEFAVAAIRFYFSMMPNMVEDLGLNPTENPKESQIQKNNNSQPQSLFLLMDEMYKSRLPNSSQKLNNILESLLNQRAMKMDSSYAESLILNYMGSDHPTRADVLAVDIQRGRDHGLQGYVKYLEQCVGISVQDWKDLEKYIEVNDINQLKTAYGNFKDVDLIVGGISEKPHKQSILGPTFTCILGEQFSRINRWHKVLESKSASYKNDMRPYMNWTGQHFLCATSQLKNVPKNIFKIISETNPLVACETLIHNL